jgi:hypothetical protein
MLYPEAEYTCAVGTGAKAKGLAMRRSPYTASGQNACKKLAPLGLVPKLIEQPELAIHVVFLLE